MADLLKKADKLAEKAFELQEKGKSKNIDKFFDAAQIYDQFYDKEVDLTKTKAPFVYLEMGKLYEGLDDDESQDTARDYYFKSCVTFDDYSEKNDKKQEAHFFFIRSLVYEFMRMPVADYTSGEETIVNYAKATYDYLEDLIDVVEKDRPYAEAWGYYAKAVSSYVCKEGNYQDYIAKAESIIQNDIIKDMEDPHPFVQGAGDMLLAKIMLSEGNVKEASAKAIYAKNELEADDMFGDLCEKVYNEVMNN